MKSALIEKDEPQKWPDFNSVPPIPMVKPKRIKCWWPCCDPLMGIFAIPVFGMVLCVVGIIWCLYNQRQEIVSFGEGEIISIWTEDCGSSPTSTVWVELKNDFGEHITCISRRKVFKMGERWSVLSDGPFYSHGRLGEKIESRR